MNSPQPLTLEEMQAKVRSAEPECFCAEHNNGADIMVRIPNSGKLNRIAQGHTANDAWIAAYQILFPSAAVSIPSHTGSEHPLNVSMRIPSVGWGDDEKVVRAAVPGAHAKHGMFGKIAVVSPTITALEPNRSFTGWCEGGADEAWRRARKHPVVQAFERKWNPEYQGGTDAVRDESVLERPAIPVEVAMAQEIAERGAFSDIGERLRFQEWARPNGIDTAMMNGDYADIQTFKMYKAWQARASLDTRGETRDVDGLKVCDTTSTPRRPRTDCGCDTYPENLGPCKQFMEGARQNQCSYCCHTQNCHIAADYGIDLKNLPNISAAPPVAAPAPRADVQSTIGE